MRTLGVEGSGMKRMLIALALAGLALPSPAAQAAETHTVFMNAIRFCNTPACAASEDTVIQAGDTVRWVFADPACVALHAIGCFHTATQTGGGTKIDSPAMPGPPATFGGTDPQLVYEVTFGPNSTGKTFDYICVIHAGPQFNMRASIIVE